MDFIKSLMHSRYADGGRGPAIFDCWGMYWWIKKHKQACQLPSFSDIHPDDKKGMTRAMQKILPDFEPCKPERFAAACGMNGEILMHIGTVIFIDNQLQIIHTSRQSGPVIDSIAKFTHLFGPENTRFYRVKDQTLATTCHDPRLSE